MRKKIPETVIKKLFGLSGNLCAFPNCSQKLILHDAVIGEICHIEAVNKKGKRFNPKQTDKEKAGFDNLLLLCPNHHKVIDKTDIYSVKELKKIKAEHLKKYGAKKIDITSKMVEEALKEYNNYYFFNMFGNQVALTGESHNVTIIQNYISKPNVPRKQKGKKHKTKPNVQTEKGNERHTLEHRLKLKKQFENYLKKHNNEVLIIRDIKRPDGYPEFYKGKGVAPWFRVFFKKLHHDGIEVYAGHFYQYVIYDEKLGIWKFADKSKEKDSTTARIIGKIPFDLIENIDFNGEYDGYNNIPHIYCKFISKKKNPYNAIMYYIYKDDYELEIEELRESC